MPRVGGIGPRPALTRSASAPGRLNNLRNGIAQVKPQAPGSKPAGAASTPPPKTGQAHDAQNAQHAQAPAQSGQAHEAQTPQKPQKPQAQHQVRDGYGGAPHPSFAHGAEEAVNAFALGAHDWATHPSPLGANNSMVEYGAALHQMWGSAGVRPEHAEKIAMAAIAINMLTGNLQGASMWAQGMAAFQAAQPFMQGLGAAQGLEGPYNMALRGTPAANRPPGAMLDPGLTAALQSVGPVAQQAQSGNMPLTGDALDMAYAVLARVEAEKKQREEEEAVRNSAGPQPAPAFRPPTPSAGKAGAGGHGSGVGGSGGRPHATTSAPGSATARSTTPPRRAASAPALRPTATTAKPAGAASAVPPRRAASAPALRPPGASRPVVTASAVPPRRTASAPALGARAGAPRPAAGPLRGPASAAASGAAPGERLARTAAKDLTGAAKIAGKELRAVGNVVDKVTHSTAFKVLEKAANVATLAVPGAGAAKAAALAAKGAIGVGAKVAANQTLRVGAKVVAREAGNLAVDSAKSTATQAAANAATDFAARRLEHKPRAPSAPAPTAKVAG